MEKQLNILEDENKPVHIDVSNIPTDDDNLEVFGRQQEHSIVMYLDPESDTKHFKKFIKSVEKLVRGNEDYKNWLKSLRDIEFLSKDAYLENVTSDFAEIQLHHFPFNLYTICSVITDKYFKEGKKVSTFIIADAVIREHFMGKIGLVPLSVTNHELAHLQKMKIIRSQIFGNWEEFFNDYVEYLDDYTIFSIRELLDNKAIKLSSDFLSLMVFKNSDGSDPEDSEEEQ